MPTSLRFFFPPLRPVSMLSDIYGDLISMISDGASLLVFFLCVNSRLCLNKNEMKNIFFSSLPSFFFVHASRNIVYRFTFFLCFVFEGDASEWEAKNLVEQYPSACLCVLDSGSTAATPASIFLLSTVPSRGAYNWMRSHCYFTQSPSISLPFPKWAYE